MKFEEYRQYDAMGLAHLVAKKDVTPKELLQLAIERTRAINPAINAVWSIFEKEAMELLAKARPEMPLYGVPFLLKDLLGELSGTTLSQGSAPYKHTRSTNNSELVEKYLLLGLVPFGKTATPEFGIMGTTEPEAFGPCRNPWGRQHSTGGSSGGSAAAVAAGIVPVASGGDGGGSLRIPASACGIFGLKPTRGRTTNAPLGELWDGATVQHVVTRSVRDSALILNMTWGASLSDPYHIAPPACDYLAQSQKSQLPLTIAYSVDHPMGKKVDLECIEAAHKTAQLLKEFGHNVVQVTLPVDGHQIARDYVTMVAGQIAQDVQETLARFGPGAFRNLEISTRTLALVGNTISAREYVGARRRWREYSRIVSQFFEKYDVYMTPTMARTPVLIGELLPTPAEKTVLNIATTLKMGKLLIWSKVLEEIAEKSFEVVPYTQLANMTGVPAMSVPVHQSALKLPIGTHFMAPWGEEGRLFQLAFQLEEAIQWAKKFPDNF
jgi:amidase